jgi:hypothetical protein
MGAGGSSTGRLGRLHDVMAGDVERSDVPGFVSLVSRRGEVYADAIGMTRHAWTSPNPPGVWLDFWASTHRSIDD